MCSSDLPSLDTTGWLPERARRELREVARLRGELAAVQAQLTNVMRTETGRDTVAALGRATGMSNRDARTAEKAASSVAAIPGAIAALRAGSVTADHLALMAGHANALDAAELLALAAGQSVEEFASTVRAREIREAGPSWRDRQRAARSVRFFKAEFGCLGMRAILPPIEGEFLRARLQRIVDQLHEREHPERARTLGGNGEEPYERRLADALVALAQGSVHADEADVADDEAKADEDKADGLTGEHDTAECVVADADEVALADDAAAVSNDRSDEAPKPARRPVGQAPQRSERRTGSRRSAHQARAQTTRPGPGRIALVVCLEASTLEAELLGHGPIGPTDVIDLTRDPRTDLYTAIRDCNGATLRFGRTRRYASALQALALAVQDRHCAWPGCTEPPQRCDVHHDPPFEEGGRTDIDQMQLLCRGRNGHHPHRHESCRAGPADVEPVASPP